MATLTPRGQRGITLIEIVLWCAIVAAAVVAVFVFGKKAAVTAAVGGGLLIKLGNVTERMSEVPLVLRYDLKGGRSGMRLTRTIRGYVELIGASVRTHRFRPAPGSRPAD